MSVGTEDLVKPPPHAIHCRNSHVWLDDERVIWMTWDEGAEAELSDLQEVAEAIRKVTGGVRRPMVADSRNYRSMSKDARVYGDEVMPELATAVAVIIGSPLTRMLATFFLRLRKGNVPMAMFEDSRAALDWARNRT